jgi:hypothetical protein
LWTNTITPSATTTNNIIFKGIASQSADLVQLQNSSGTVLNAIDNGGNIRSETQLVQYGAEGSLLQNVPTRVHPGETLLKQAVWWIDAAHVSSSGQTIKNLGWGGSALDCTLGSSTSADSNDPQYLAWDGVNYVYLPGVTGNYLSVPDAATLDITGDLDLRAYVALDDWTPSAIMSLVTKWDPTGNQRSYNLSVNTDGTLILYVSTNGTAITTNTSTAATGITDGSVRWVRATLDVDNGSSQNEVKFWTSTDGTSWTQLGNTITNSGTTSVFAGTANVVIAAQGNTANPTAGKIYRAQVCNGIDGTPVLDVDTSVITSGSATSFTALTGQTVTINRATSGRKTVAVTNPLWLFGTDDYMEVNNRWLEHTGTNYLYLPGVSGNYASTPDSAALDITGDIDLRCKLALDDWTPASNADLITKRGNGSTQQSYFMNINSTGNIEFRWSSDGSTFNTKASTVATGIADGTTKWLRVTLDVDNGAAGNDVKFFTSDDGSTWTQLGTTVTTAGTTSIFASTSILEIGSFNTGANNNARGKFFRAQVYNGIAGTLAFDANFETGITTNLPTTFTESSANAATVTVNYSGTGYRSAGVIASTYVYPGNPNTFKLSTVDFLSFNSTDSYSLFTAIRYWNATASNRVLIGKQYSSNGDGYSTSFWTNTLQPAANLDDGVTTTKIQTTTAVTAGQLSNITGVTNRSAQTITAYLNAGTGSSSSISTIGAPAYIAQAFPFRVGAHNDSTSFNTDMEFIAGAVFRRVLTEAEIAILNNYFQGRIS